MIVTIAVASYAVGIVMLGYDRAGAFFLLPSRAWELLVGVMLVWIPPPRQAWLGHTVRVAGVAMIVIPVLAYTPASVYPGSNALLTVAGAAIYLWGGPTSWRAPPVEFIGKMSYSLYLWHWPIYTLAKLRSVTMMFSTLEKAALAGLLFCVAYASWRLIERPMRGAISRPVETFNLAALATGALLLIVNIGAKVWPSPTVNDGPYIARLMAYDSVPMNAMPAKSCFVSDWSADNHTGCFARRSSRPQVLIWGDSLAEHLVPAFERSAGDHVDILHANAPGCFPAFTTAMAQWQFCYNLASRIRQAVENHKPSMMILSADWPAYMRRFGKREMIAELRATIASLNVPVVLIGPSVQFRSSLPMMLIRAERRGASLKAADIMIDGLFDLDDAMHAAFMDMPGVTYLSALHVLCPDRFCPLTLSDGTPVTRDQGHLTPEAAEYLMKGMAPLIFGRFAGAPLENRR